MTIKNLVEANSETISDFTRKLLVSRYTILQYYSDMNIDHMLPSIQEVRDANSDAFKMEKVIHKFILFLNFLRKTAGELTDEEKQKEIIFPAEHVLDWLLKILDLQPIYVATT